MNNFECWISKIEDKTKAISIHRDVLYAERFAEEPHEHSLLNGNIINDEAVIWHFRLARALVFTLRHILRRAW